MVEETNLEEEQEQKERERKSDYTLSVGFQCFSNKTVPLFPNISNECNMALVASVLLFFLLRNCFLVP